MRRFIIIIIGIAMALGGCGTVVTEERTNFDYADNETAVVQETANERDEIQEDVGEEETTTSMALYESFLGLNEELVTAICDIDFYLADSDYNTILECAEGDSFSFEDLKKVLDSITYGEPELFYTYFYSETENPILCVLIPQNFTYIDENNCLLLFSCYDGEVHLVDDYNNMDEAYTNIYVVKDGLISSQSRALGRSSGSIISCYTGIVDNNGSIQNLFTELILDCDAYEYIDDKTGIGSLIQEIYAASDSYVSIGEVTVGENTYYIIYPDGLDAQSDEELIVRCAEIGINLQSRDEVIAYCEEYASSLGYNIDIYALDENAVVWNSIK